MLFEMVQWIPRNGHSKVGESKWALISCIQSLNFNAIFSCWRMEFLSFFLRSWRTECFHIERIGVNYKIQYCIGRLIFETAEHRKAKKVQQNTVDWPFRGGLDAYRTGLSISFGIHLPLVCAARNQVWIAEDYFQTVDFIALQVVV